MTLMNHHLHRLRISLCTCEREKRSLEGKTAGQNKKSNLLQAYKTVCHYVINTRGITKHAEKNRSCAGDKEDQCIMGTVSITL